MMSTTNSLSTNGTSFHPFQLPALPFTSESLTDGTDIPPPSPSPPPKPKVAPPLRTDFSSLPFPDSPNPLRQHPTSASDFATPPSTALSSRTGSPYSPASRTTLPTPDHLSKPRTTISQIDYLSSTVRLNNPIKPKISQPQAASFSVTTIETQPQAKKRPSSIRKFLSLRSLNYTNKANPSSVPARPESPLSVSTTSSYRPSLKKKRSSAFWGLRKSSLMVYEDGMTENTRVESYNGKESYEDRRENMRPESYQQQEEEEERKPSPPPMLPELGKVNVDGFLGGGDMFRDIN